jgi:very-short-patch-repair endonuclease
VSLDPVGVPLPEPILGGRCFLRKDAVAAGFSDRRFRSLLGRGDITQILYGVYVDVRTAEDPSTRLAALDLVRPPDAVVCRRTAAWLRGIDVGGTSPTTPRAVECVVPNGRMPIRRAGVRCYSAPLEEDVEEVDGIPITTPTRTALDLLRYLPPHLGLGAADAMAHLGLFSVTALSELADECRYGRNIRRARQLASYCEPAAESFGESWLRLRILDAGFPRPDAQVQLGREFRLDLGYLDRRLGIEYDGMEFHSAPADRRHDESRRARIRDEYGWTVLAVGRGEVLGQSLALERSLGDLLGLEPKIRKRTW